MKRGSTWSIRKGLIWRGCNKRIRLGGMKKMEVDPHPLKIMLGRVSKVVEIVFPNWKLIRTKL